MKPNGSGAVASCATKPFGRPPQPAVDTHCMTTSGRTMPISGVPLEIGIVRPDVVMQCVSTAGCGGLPNGFVAQLATAPLPLGFIAVVNTPGGGASRNVRRPDLIAGVNPYLTAD